MEPIDLPCPGGEPGTLTLLRTILDDTTRMRRAEIGPLTDTIVRWQVAPGTHSIGAVMMHIIETEAQWIHEVLAGEARSPEERRIQQAEATDQWNGVWADPPAESWEALLAYHDTIRQRSHALLDHLADPTGTAPFGPRAVTARWVIKHIITHEAYHFGQIELLRQQAISAVG